MHTILRSFVRVVPLGALATALILLRGLELAAQVPSIPKAWEHRIEKPNKQRLPKDDPEWIAKNPQADNPWWTELLLSEDEQRVLVLKPEVVRVYSAADGTLQWEQRRDQLFRSLGASTSRGMEQLPASTFYVPVPHLNAVLDLYYGNKREQITLIDLETQEARWVNADLKWSLERYAFLARLLLQATASRGQQIAGGAVADFLLPDRVVTNLIRPIPAVNGLLVKTIGGLTMLDLATGAVRWESSEFKGGLAFVHFDPASKDIILVNRDDDAFAIPGIQLRKQLMRINAESGTVRWNKNYVGMMIDRVDGVVGNFSNRETDIRVEGDLLILNFLDFQAYDINTGEERWRHPTALPRFIAAMTPETNVTTLVAFPKVEGSVIYRPYVAFAGMGWTSTLEAYDLASGDKRWVAENLSRGAQWINSFVILPDRVIVSFDGAGGVTAIEKASGKVLWNVPMQLKGLQEPLFEAGGTVLVRIKNSVVGLDTQTGAKRYEIDAKTLKIGGTGLLAAGAGQLSRSLVQDGVALIPGPIGAALLDVATGKVLTHVEYPAARRVDNFQYRVTRRTDGKALLEPTASIGSIVLADPAARNLLGVIPTSATRTRLRVTRDGRRAFTLDDGLLQRFDLP